VRSYLDDLISWAPLLLAGLGNTLLMSIAGMALSLIVGFAVGLLRTLAFDGPMRAVGWILKCYVEVLRGLPLIVTLFLVYFGLPAVGVRFAETPIQAGLLALTLHLGAYLSETFRAALLAVHPGQLEAALGMGMSRFAAYRRIVLPQALVIAVPTLGSWFISLLKETSLLSFISVGELMRAGVVIVNQTFKPFEGYITLGAIYLVLSLTASWFVGKIEARLTRSMRPQEPDRTQSQAVRQPMTAESLNG